MAKVKIKHVIALDLSKGKSIIAIYDGYRQWEFEATGVYSKPVETFFKDYGMHTAAWISCTRCTHNSLHMQINE